MVMEISALQALKLAENFLSVLFLWNSCSTLQMLRKTEDWQPLRRHFRWISLSSRGELDKSTSHWVVWYSHALPMRTRTGLPLVCLRQGLGLAILGFSANDGRVRFLQWTRLEDIGLHVSPDTPTSWNWTFQSRQMFEICRPEENKEDISNWRKNLGDTPWQDHYASFSLIEKLTNRLASRPSSCVRWGIPDPGYTKANFTMAWPTLDTGVTSIESCILPICRGWNHPFVNCESFSKWP